MTPAEASQSKSNVLDLPPDPRKRNRKRWIIGLSTFVALIITLVLVLSFSPILAIKNIQVEGNSLVKDKELDSALEPLHGVPLARVGTGTVMELLQDLPAVKDAIVQTEIPSTLNIKIVEHQPVAILIDGSKRSLVGAEGQTLVTLGAKDKPKLPEVKATKAIKDPKVFSMLTRVLSGLPDKLLASVDHATATSKDFVELNLKNGVKVIWGNDQEIALKTKVLEALLGAEKDKESPIKVYDISSPQHPVAR
ncbi:hypothetical protein CQ018_00810 [Arthrobacter sp. MYb227]|uniref:cell division protein FtsQ/DivIB n=1 Tax=Arthrobacter sp. MYb227 TaxID=1848601 RepID=UPI000CFC357D|nr:FtsQ-type POTRA domain-containing protein [Arthrobacter sp. MYb227]PQZ95872.1 hypothetical protein CQ018_00810 [Arthrobacter sp. MYb227]